MYKTARFAGETVTVTLVGAGIAKTGAWALSRVGPWLESKTILRNLKAADFSTGANEAVFYSGSGNRAKALEFANRAGKTPIDFTPGGRYLESLDLYPKLGSKLADKIWVEASKLYAEGASGKINLFVKGALPNRVFKMAEESILKNNANIYKWIYRGY